MKKLDIKYFSQYSEQVKEEWRPKVCGIACVKMILDFLGYKNNPNDLIEEGLLIGGYSEKDGGWFHEALVIILRNHGVLSYRQEFKRSDFLIREKKIVPNDDGNFLNRGISKIHSSLDKGNPVIVSVSADFAKTSSNHLVLVSGFAEDEVGLEGFFIHDPNAKDSSKEHVFVELKDFMSGFRHLAIFIEK